MGGRHSRHRGNSGGGSQSHQPPLPALVLIDWDAAFLGARMAEAGPGAAGAGAGAATAAATAAAAADPTHDALAASSPALAQAFRPLVDARRLIALAEEGTARQPPAAPTSSLAGSHPLPPPTPPLNVRGRLALFSPDLSVLNHRLFRLFHRRHYRPIIAPRELQAHAVARALGRFGRRGARRRQRGRHHATPGIVVVVAGDGGLERHPAFVAALRGLLHQGFGLEAWAWTGFGGGPALQLYQELAAHFPSTASGGGVRLRSLDEHRARLRYGGVGLTGRGGLDGLVASTLHSVAAAVVGAGGALLAAPSAPPHPPSAVQESLTQAPAAVPVAMPLAVGVKGGGGGGEGEGVVQWGKLVESSSDEDEEDNDKGSDEEGGGAGAAAAAAASGPGGPSAAASSGGEEEEELPDYLLDPLTFEPLDDPVSVPSGYTFSRAVILDQIRRRGTDPFTNAPLAEADLRPNRALAEAVTSYREGRARPAVAAATGQEGQGGQGGGAA